MGAVFFLFSPVILTMYAIAIIFIITLFIIIGVCLIVIGVTGKAMNKMYGKYTGEEKTVSKHSYNTLSVIIGIAFIVITLGTVVYGIISLVAQ